MKRINLSLLLTFLFIVLVMLIKTNGINEFDTSIGKGMYTLHDQSLILVLEWIGMLGSTVGIIAILFLSMLLFIIIQKNFLAAAILFLSVLIGNVGNKVLKAIVERERPSFPEHIEDSFSFPSGHVMVGLLLFGMITYYVVKASQTQKMKQIVITSTSVLLIFIGFSRLVEGEHFFTDVIGGFIAGGLVLIAMITVDQLVRTKIEQRKVKNDVSF
ncbi:MULTISPECIES: phosphatase PAP2 family protein [Metabacillus]|uniref:Phosphatase PAP2 family protein n=1 Tax=Metabacillus rhizolycopersici TaxID=2875709 RepID=A0ABS7URU7_9BACI|nr:MULTISPECIES: phosphatase PAP2 family protein [Metabacillus]MBZ5750792.1 phosphatase PAP2 family protein [Metabacillus rhizolycopersici]MCM3651068.1 phosphatase PAP2 family protein [Metabacillus litoralis]